MGCLLSNRQRSGVHIYLEPFVNSSDLLIKHESAMIRMLYRFIRRMLGHLHVRMVNGV